MGYLVHGTTVATNAIIEGKLAPAGFITTEGFRDMLEIQRQIRPSLYDLLFEKPRPLAPRYLCFGIPERLDATGAVVTPLDAQAVADAAAQLKAEGVEALAVCYLHAYLNPEHERRTREIVHEVFPEAVVSLSSEVAPEFREYFRASTTLINAGVRPIVERYLASIESRLRDTGLQGQLLVMQSSGGVLTFEAARTKPVYMVESGPAAGVIVSAYLGEVLGFDNILSFDMGGTTAKAGLVEHGTPTITKEYEVGTAARAERGAKGAGYPIRTPVIDLVEIGAGGGSIAWVDSGGVLRVGPQSAGADPAPACYGNGGTEPTITDANLVLKRLDPDHFLGGEMRLDEAAAWRAIKESCADPLGLDVLDVALGIVEIANNAMVSALRRISVQRGYDPRDFVLVAFGGAGPVHANRLAAELDIPTVLVPMSPGTSSAMGLLVTDIKHDYSATLIQRTDRLDTERVNRLYREMEARGRAGPAQRGHGAREHRVRAVGGHAIRRTELRAVHSVGRRRGGGLARPDAGGLPRRAPARLRIRGTGRAGGVRDPAAHGSRQDREAEAERASRRQGRRGGGTSRRAPGLLRRGRRIRGLPELRPLPAPRRRSGRRPGHRRGDGLDHGNPSRLPRRGGSVRKPPHRGGRMRRHGLPPRH